MSLSNLSSAQLQQFIALVKEREQLLARLNQVHSQLDRLSLGKTDKKTRSNRTGKAKRKPRGQLKESILKALGSAGDKGATVKDLATKVGATAATVAVWFYTTGKKIEGIKKVGKAQYAYLPKKNSAE